MKLLIIGGTVFLGRAIVAAALARGHEVTLFNRGQHNPDLFPEVEKIRGNRDGELDALRHRKWDAAIDTCGYYPRVVRQSAEALSGAVEHYTFISSISVYADFRQPWDEEGPLGQIDPEEAEAADQITAENYGPLKVQCEQTVRNEFPEGALIIRPGLIVGPHDPSDRFTYWPVRVDRGGDVLVPGRGEQRMEIIDVRDLAEWNVRMVEAGKVGVYNATGPDYPLTMETFLTTCKTETAREAQFVYVPGEFLKQHEVEADRVNCWWVPDTAEEYRYFSEINCDRGRAEGLVYRPLKETIRDTLAWAASRPSDWQWRVGLAPELEARLLDLWKKAM